ncbi:hypothetical protein GCM10009624_04040 [Gordonia sinesedis]
MTGFTGVLWDARTTERLAADLAAGPGAGPLAEAGAAWGALAADLAETSVAYTAILGRLGVNWQSDRSTAAVEHLASLGRWFVEASAAAAETAARAEAQAAAVAVARLAMPNPAEIDLVGRMREVATATAVIAPAIAGAAAHAERAVHEVKLRAARVMETYESASEPVARPWRAAHPAPNLVSAGPLEAEQAARDTAERAAQSPAGTGRHAAPAGVPVMAPVMLAGGIGEREKTRYAPTVLASGTAVPVPAPPATAAPPPAPTPVPPPVVPGAMAAGDARIRTSPGPVAEPVADDMAESPHSASVADAAPTTWAELATSNQSVVQHVSVDGDTGTDGTGMRLDPRYLSERLWLDDDAGQRIGSER